MKSKIIAVALLGMLLYSCASKPVTTTTTEVKSVALTAVQTEGKTLYENNCAKCHKLYDTKAFSVTEWTPILISMQKKAKLQDADIEKIHAYITAN
jgi:cytochrome c5